MGTARKSRRTARVLDQLRRFESRNVTHIDPDGAWPVVWTRARGVHVWDIEGRRYLDLTAAFGVTATGHANPRVVAAARRQLTTLPHAMGDVHPHPLKGELARELSRITFERWTRAASPGATPAEAKTLFCNSGFEAVEAAMKTAFLATRRRGVLAFKSAYHGLGYGTLNTTYREHFRGPFAGQLAQFGKFVPFPQLPEELAAAEKLIRAEFRSADIGAILVEPVQVRGGIRVPPPGFLGLLRALCDEYGALLLIDEIYTGFGRTGRWFACEHDGVIPDIICLGKALTGGFPLSACVGRAAILDAWPESRGEAIHTSTFLGHPVGCAMALAQLQEIRRRRLVQRSAALGRTLIEALTRLTNIQLPVRVACRGFGLLAGLEFRHHDGRPASDFTWSLVKALLKDGFLFLPDGDTANVLAFSPPLTITARQLGEAVEAVATRLAVGLPA
jgi:4-aminobutyrate aminotransferase-like enzyme